MSAFQGKLHAGPFSVLIQQNIAWKVDRPHFLVDHYNLKHDLLTLGNKQLLRLLEDGWLQKIALTIVKRKDFCGLYGISWEACKHVQTPLTAPPNTTNFTTAKPLTLPSIDAFNVRRLPHDSPVWLRERFLLPRNPYAQSVRTAFHQLRDQQVHYELLAKQNQVFLFSDGSCTSPTYRPLAKASWAVVSATHNGCLTAGPLAGLDPSIDRAE